MKKQSIGARRLLALADFLEKDRPAKIRFDMGTWGQFRQSVEDAPKKGIRWVTWMFGNKKKATRNLNICGTAACALGHASLVPSLYKAGMRLLDDGSDGATPCVVKDGHVTSFGSTKVTRDLFYVKNEQLFQAINLWSASIHDGATPKSMAREIRKEVRRLESVGGFTK